MLFMDFNQLVNPISVYKINWNQYFNVEIRDVESCKRRGIYAPFGTAVLESIAASVIAGARRASCWERHERYPGAQYGTQFATLPAIFVTKLHRTFLTSHFVTIGQDNFFLFSSGQAKWVIIVCWLNIINFIIPFRNVVKELHLTSVSLVEKIETNNLLDKSRVQHPTVNTYNINTILFILKYFPFHVTRFHDLLLNF